MGGAVGSSSSESSAASDMLIDSAPNLMRTPLAVAFVSAVACAQSRSEFRDPAPPAAVRELEPAEAPEPSEFAELTIAGRPSPLPASARVEDWPGFLGPRRDGKSRETDLLTEWPRGGPKLVWSMRRGEGYASPVVQGGRLVFTHRIGRSVHVDCLDPESGKRFWRFTYASDYRGTYISNSGPCATPQIEGDRVWLHGVEGEFHCLELATGRVVWKRNLKREFQLEDQFFGVVSSPLLRGELLIINLGVPDGPCVAAFDKRSGRMVWGAGKRWGMSCASPVVAQLDGRDRLFVLTGGKSRPPTGGLMAIDLERGKTIAEFPFRSRRYESVNGSCPVVVDDTVILTSAYGTGTVGVTIDGAGEAKQAWKRRRLGVEFSAPIEVGGNLYLVDGIRNRGGAIVCLDPRSGETKSRTELLWEDEVMLRGEKRTIDAGVGTGSLLHIGGDIFLCLGDNGHLLRLRCTPKGAEILDRVSLFRAAESWTPLALSRGLLYVCQNKRERIGSEPRRLLCYDLRGS